MQKAFQGMFTASQVGLGVGNAGVGRESQSEQSEFKDSLITSLLSSHSSISMPSILPIALLAVWRRLLYSTRLHPLPRYVLVRRLLYYTRLRPLPSLRSRACVLVALGLSRYLARVSSSPALCVLSTFRLPVSDNACPCPIRRSSLPCCLFASHSINPAALR